MTRHDITWVPCSEYRRTWYGVVQIEDEDDDSYVVGCIDRYAKMQLASEQLTLSGSHVSSFLRWVLPVIAEMPGYDFGGANLTEVQPMTLSEHSGMVFDMAYEEDMLRQAPDLSLECLPALRPCLAA